MINTQGISRKREHIPRCALCGSDRFLELFRQTDYVHKTTQEMFLYVRCEGCGLVFLQDRPPKEEMSRYYPDHYSFYRMGRLEPIKDAVKSVLYKTYYTKDLSYLPLRPVLYPIYRLLKSRGALNAIRSYREYPYLPEGRFKLLDVGCGSGTTFHPFGRKYSLLWLHQKGHRLCEGVEVDGRACAVAKDYGLTVHQGDFFDMEFPQESYDIVRFNHSLEHVYAPDAYLRRAHRVLKTGGQIIISVPNYSGLVHTLFPDAVESPRHLYYFSPACLARFLESNGFKVILTRTDATPEVLAFVLQELGRLPPHLREPDLVLKLLPAYRIFAEQGYGDDFNMVARKV
jgi:SAM-dependent methyltransferase